MRESSIIITGSGDLGAGSSSIPPHVVEMTADATVERMNTEAFPSSDGAHLIYARARAVHISPLGDPDAASGIGSAGRRSVEVPQPTIVPCPAFAVTFVDALLAVASRSLDLVRVSLTVPKEREVDLVTFMHEYAAEIATGKGHGAWLVIDLRPDTLAPHAYGLVLVDAATKATLVPRWCAKTGADPNALRGRKVLTTVWGWPRYARTGDARTIRTHLLRPNAPGYGIVTYGLKPLPNGETRDLDGEHVAVSGALAGPWRTSRAAGEGSEPSSPRARIPSMGQSVPRRCTCEVCDGDIPVRKRSHAKTCSTKCRMKKRDRTKERRKRGAEAPRTRSRRSALVPVDRILVSYVPW